MARQAVDLNCDLGENFGYWRISEATDEELMDLISSANVATGFHAGDPNLMDKVVKGAVERGVAIGAHPGYRDLQGFGRRVIQANPDELVNDIIYQLGSLREFARRHGTKLQHLKPHGALYMEAARSAELSELLVDALAKCSPEILIFCMDVSETYRVAKAAGLRPVREFYADRDYDSSGSIVFTRRMRALNPDEVAEKCLRACQEGKVRTVDNEDVEVTFASICFHSDPPGALQIGIAVRRKLVEAGIRILPAEVILAEES